MGILPSGARNCGPGGKFCRREFVVEVRVKSLNSGGNIAIGSSRLRFVVEVRVKLISPDENIVIVVEVRVGALPSGACD